MSGRTVSGVTRSFQVGGRFNLDWRTDATNVLNRVTYSGVNTIVGSPQFGLPNRDRGIVLVGNIVGDRDRLEAVRALQFLVDALHFVGRQLEQLRQLRDHSRGVGQLLRNDIDPETGPVDGDRLAVAVDDPAPPWRDRDQLHPVALAQQLVFLVLGDRQPAEPADEQGADRGLCTAEQHHPPREGDRLMSAGQAGCAAH